MFYNKKIFDRCFTYRGRWWYKNIRWIPTYFKQIHHLTKHGYDIGATWDTYDWFLTTLKPILVEYRKTHIGYPILDSNISSNIQALGGSSDEEEWDKIIDRMIELLDLMDECNEKYDGPQYQEDIWKVDREMNEAKDEFFKLFSEHFYRLWD